jgi:aspartate carbamoyltransferase catalytic subunit
MRAALNPAPARSASSSGRLAAPRRAPSRARPAPPPRSSPQDWASQPIRHTIESQQFTRASLDLIFAEAQRCESIKPGSPESKALEGYVMSTLFYEPSTRTRLSFESAMARLGGTVLSTESAGEYSSAAKGETLEGERRRGRGGEG